MIKATGTIRCIFPNGATTIVMTENNKMYLRAYDTARLFGFKDEKACIRNYANTTFTVIINTDGGEQPVKCITFPDMIKIASKSRLSDAQMTCEELILSAEEFKYRALEKEALLLKNQLGIAIEGLMTLRKQLDDILAKVE